MAAATATATTTVTANGDAAAAVLDELKPPPGVVLPPREIRNVLEKTAGYVARNGPEFEDRVREKEAQNPKFCFVNPSDAYYAFYRWRLNEVKSGRGTDIAAGRVRDAPTELEKPKGPPKPPDFDFSARMPRINQKDLEVIRLTALFVAKNGRQFMTQLAQRETANPQFQFLIPNHTFHNFFQHIVEQYTVLIRAGGIDGEGGKLQAERTAELERNIEDKWRVLARAKQRAEYAKSQELERQKKEEEEEMKKQEFARIDWGDFVVVETITFSEADETANLPPPTNLSELQYASLEDRNKASISANLRIEEAYPDEDLSNTGLAAFQPQPAQPLSGYSGPNAHQSPQPGQLPAGQAYSNGQHPQMPPHEDEEARRIQERAEAQARMQQAQSEARGGAPPMKIRENYVPRAAQRTATRPGAPTALCPNCKQQIPINELEAHMRIELLDPRWKEQKAAAESRYSATISGAEIAQNLKRLASQRHDLVDATTGQSTSEDELARRKRAALNPPEGQPESRPQPMMPQTVNVEEQIRAIHQKFAGDKK
ncbi:hypothetical protein E4U37_000920 [Claviceps purpurea]|nr:hypothetical protein E4U37_000920 [Claviceps purpurea]